MSRRRLGLRKRLALNIFSDLYSSTVAEHRLDTLFWECTLRCNLSCRHCGSDLFFFRQLFRQRFQLARLIIKQSGLHIARHIYQHRAGTACFRQLEGQPDRLR